VKPVAPGAMRIGLTDDPSTVPVDLSWAATNWTLLSEPTSDIRISSVLRQRLAEEHRPRSKNGSCSCLPLLTVSALQQSQNMAPPRSRL